MSLNSLNWRYATKRYDPLKKLTPEQLQRIKDALRLSPSSFGLQAWKFIHVTDSKIREQLKAAAWDQTPVTDASDFFVLAHYTKIDEAFLNHHIDNVAKVRGVSVESLRPMHDRILPYIQAKSPEAMQTWLSRQVYIALGFALTAAAEQGIDSTPIEGFDPKAFDAILGLPAFGLESRVSLAVGFRSTEDAYQHEKKVRFPESEVFMEK